MTVILTFVSKAGNTFREHSQFSIPSYKVPFLVMFVDL